MGFMNFAGVSGVIRKLMPIAPVCPMFAERSEILIALLLTSWLAIEFASLDVRKLCAYLLSGRFVLGITVSRAARMFDETGLCITPFSPSLSSRAPPTF